MKNLIIVRHAERSDILPDRVGDDVMLTDKGIEQSKAFVSLIDLPILSIKSSPIKRCVQTAKLIAQSANYKIKDIKTCTSLGDPGFIINDSDLAWQHWLNKDHDAVNQYLISGTEVWEGFYDLDYVVKETFFTIKTLLNDSPFGTHIWVTHDTILATLASRVNTSKLTLKEWPNFLGYLKFTCSDKGVLDIDYVQSPNFNKINLL